MNVSASVRTLTLPRSKCFPCSKFKTGRIRLMTLITLLYHDKMDFCNTWKLIMKIKSIFKRAITSLNTNHIIIGMLLSIKKCNRNRKFLPSQDTGTGVTVRKSGRCKGTGCCDGGGHLQIRASTPSCTDVPRPEFKRNRAFCRITWINFDFLMPYDKINDYD